MLKFIAVRPTAARASAITVLICATGLVAPAVGQVPSDFPKEILFNAAEESWARVTLIVPPEYPKDALANGIGSVVDITVVVGLDGLIKEVQRVEATPNDPRFVDATREVLKFWRFRNAISMRCEPIETVGDVRLTFSVVNGKEHISLSHRAAPANADPRKQTLQRTPPPLVSLNYAELAKEARYPEKARREGVQADVWVRVTIDPPSGTVVESESAHVVSYPRRNENTFRAVSAFTMKSLKFVPVPQRKDPVTACVPVRYRLSN